MPDTDSARTVIGDRFLIQSIARKGMQQQAKKWESQVKIEDAYQDVLQNIEASIVSVYRQDTSIADSSVIRVLEAIIGHYVAEDIGREPIKASFTEEENQMLNTVKATCDLRLGRVSVETVPIEPVTKDEIVQCLKRILKSVNKWNKRNGMQGYLRFVSKYV
jgi:hypothetical protein